MSVLLTTTSTPGSGLAGQYQKFFDKKLLTAVLQLLVMDQFGQVRPLPPNMGALTVRFTRPPAPDSTTVQSLTEGDPSTLTDRAFGWTHIDASLAQVGQKARISDIVGSTNLFDTLKGMTTLMGQDAAHYLDLAITKEIVPNATTNVIYGGGQSSWANLAAAGTADAVMSINDILKAFTKLTIKRAPKASANDRAPKARGGDYVCVVPPQLGYNVKLDSKFIDAGIRGNNDGLFNGEMGTWYGLRLILGTQPFVENVASAENTYDTTASIPNSVYSAICMGSEQFGIVNLASQSPFGPKVIVVDTPDSGNPLLQYTTVGWKAYFVVKTLKEDWASVIKARTTFA